MIQRYQIHHCSQYHCLRNSDICKEGFPKPIHSKTEFVDGKLIYKRKNKC